MDEKYSFGIGVQCLLVKNNKILLGKRLNIFGDGTWGLPGGRLERGETIMETAKRELAEETGLQPLNMKIFDVSNPSKENNYFLQIGVLINHWIGQPENLEPNRCSALVFFDLDDLPTPLFIGSEFLIMQIKQNLTEMN